MQSCVVKTLIPGSEPESYQFFRIYKSEAYKDEDVNNDTLLEIVPTTSESPYDEIGAIVKNTFKNIKNGIKNGEFIPVDVNCPFLKLIKGGKKSRKNRKRKTKLKRRRTARKRTYRF